MDITEAILIGFGATIGSIIVAYILDVFVTGFDINAIKNSTATALNAEMAVTQLAINTNQSVGSQVINAMLVASGTEDVKHQLEKKVEQK